MQLFALLPKNDPYSKRIEEKILALSTTLPVTVLREPSELSEQLRKPGTDSSLYILLATKHLPQLIKLKDVLNRQTLFILHPKLESEILQEMYRLNPKFIFGLTDYEIHSFTETLRHVVQSNEPTRRATKLPQKAKQQTEK